MKTYTVLYRRNLKTSLKQADVFNPDEYVSVGEVKAESIDDLFALLNDATDVPNPLGSPENQAVIRSNYLHTSMSVGDAAIDHSTGKVLICEAFGWSEHEAKQSV